MIRTRITPLICTLGLAATALHANAADGEINFSGSVDTSTCAISVGNTSGGVPGEAFIGKVSKNALQNAGDVAGGGHFTLLVDASDAGCDLTGKAASVTFIGLSGAAGPTGQWLGLERVAGGATNVAIQIRDGNGNEVRLNEASAEYLTPAEPMAFSANFIATGVATAGPAKGKASFTVDIH
jgi:major type 1 subunit fimbrin (pilin)